MSAIKNDKLEVSKIKFIYNKTRRKDFEQALCEETNVNELNALFTQPNLNCAIVDEGISKINNIILNAAKKA